MDDKIIKLRGLEFYFFYILRENNKFDLHKFPDSKSGSISYEKVKVEIEKYLEISDNTPIDLQEEIMGPIIFKEIREQVSKRLKNDDFMRNLEFYVSSIFQDFESFLREEVDLVEDYIRLVLDEYTSSLII